MAQPSPFAGVKLTEQTPVKPAGLDQRLFQPDNGQKEAAEPSLQPSKVARKETSKVGTLETRNQGTLEPLSVKVEKELFDINQQAHRSNTFVFTDEELWALEDAKIELRRKYDLEKVTKYDIVRCALHCLLEDYRDRKGQSFLVRRLSRKR